MGKCFDIPGPTEEQRNRYYCIEKCHQLCEKCKGICRCGSAVGNCPNPSINEILKDLPMCCPHYKTGCREIFVQAEDLEDHQQSCVFRTVYCPENIYACRNRKYIQFKDITEHLATFHPYPPTPTSVIIEGKKCVFYLPFSRGGWLPRKVELINGVDFYLVGKVVNSIMYAWIYFLGSPLEAKNYAYTMSVGGSNGIKSSFHDQVIPLDEGANDIIAEKSVFMIGSRAMKKLCDENSKVPVEVTIHALKEEAKDSDMESGVSA